MSLKSYGRRVRSWKPSRRLINMWIPETVEDAKSSKRSKSKIGLAAFSDRTAVKMSNIFTGSYWPLIGA